MIEVTVNKLGLDSSTNSYVVILKEKAGERYLPIWIGEPEAQSIVMVMNGVKAQRPNTHDLCKRLIIGLKGSLRRVQITRVKDNTYFAELHIQRDGDVIQIDARPSDSIAVALRLQAPIFAEESLLTKIDVDESDESESASEEPDLTPAADEPGEGITGEQLKEHLEKMRPEDFGKFHL